jgi:hypothetical protein
VPQVECQWREVRFCFSEDKRLVNQFTVTRDAYRTTDDRFIAKELSKAELQAMETFAPAYFDYMSSSVHSNVRFCFSVMTNLTFPTASDPPSEGVWVL